VAEAPEQESPLPVKEQRRRQVAQPELAPPVREADLVIAPSCIPPISRQVSDQVWKYVSSSFAQALERELTRRALG